MPERDDLTAFGVDESLLNFIIKHEGSVRNKQKQHIAYREGRGKDKRLTIGYGHLIVEGGGFSESSVLSEAEAQELLRADVRTKAQHVKTLYERENPDKSFSELPRLSRQALIETAFQAGPRWGPKFRRAVAAGDIQEAIRQTDMTADGVRLDSRNLSRIRTFWLPQLDNLEAPS